MDKILKIGFLSFILILSTNFVHADAGKGLDFTVHAVVLDGIRSSFVQDALKQTGNFIRSHSRLNPSFTVSESTLPHSYTDFGQEKVDLRYSDLDPSLLSNLPVADFYIFFYKTNGQPPVNAGSTWPEWELIVGGQGRPYASIPADLWWFNNDSFEGIPSRKAQIIVHELNNQINQILRKSPYSCQEMTATDGLPADRYEGERLAHLDSACFERVLTFHQPTPITLPPDPVPIGSRIFTVDMRAGSTDASTGGQVTMLQNFLRTAGFFSTDSSGYFGSITKAAVINFQMFNSISPSAGFVGPLTRALIATGAYKSYPGSN